MHALFLALGFVLVPSTAFHAAPGAPDDRDLHERIQRAAEAAPDGLFVRVEQTRLVAVNRSPEPFVLVFAAPDRGTLLARALAPGALLEVWHPPSGLAGLSLEVLAAPAGYLSSSGRLVLDGLELSLIVQAGGPPPARLTVAADRPVARSASQLPIASAAGERPPLHVPIPSPADKPPGETPPPVEDEPLPPV